MYRCRDIEIYRMNMHGARAWRKGKRGRGGKAHGTRGEKIRGVTREAVKLPDFRNRRGETARARVRFSVSERNGVDAVKERTQRRRARPCRAARIRSRTIAL